VNIFEFFETQWEQYINKLQKAKKGKFYSHKGSYIVFVNDSTYVGKIEEFMQWALRYWYQDFTKVIIYKRKAELAIKKAINETPGRQYVFMEVRIADDNSAP